MTAFFEACNVAFAALCPPTVISLYLWRVALPFTCDARVHRPSTRGSHERKLLRSRLRVVLGTLYRREGIHQGRETEGTLGHRRNGCGSADLQSSKKQNHGARAGGQEGRQAFRHFRAYSSLNPAAKQSSTHLARMIRWIACNVHCCRDWGERGGGIRRNGRMGVPVP